MSNFGVSPSKLIKQVSDFAPMQILIESDKNTIDSIASGLAFSNASADLIRKRLRSVSTGLDGVGKKMRSMKRTLGDISSTYSKTERRIVDQTVLPGVKVHSSVNNKETHDNVSVKDGKISTSKGFSMSKAAGGATAASVYGSASAEGKILSAELENQTNRYKNEHEIGANASRKGSLSVAEGKASLNSKYAAASVAGSFVAIKGSGAAKASVGYKDGNLYGELSAKSEVKASVAHGEAQAKLGTDYLDMHGKAEGTVLGAEASADIGVVVHENGTAEVKAKAKLQAYLAKGEVSGGYNIFGFKVDVKLDGMIGVQAKAGGSYSTSSAELELGLGPVGGKVALDWSEFKPPKFGEIIAWLY